MPDSLRGDFTESPVLSLAPWSRGDRERAECAKNVCDVCHDVGFFVLADHGIDARLLDSVFSLSRRRFDLPLEKEQLIDKRRHVLEDRRSASSVNPSGNTSIATARPRFASRAR